VRLPKVIPNTESRVRREFLESALVQPGQGRCTDLSRPETLRWRKADQIMMRNDALVRLLKSFHQSRVRTFSFVSMG
jgi:hypothetical protein